jgi:hypothetical protein
MPTSNPFLHFLLVPGEQQIVRVFIRNFPYLGNEELSRQLAKLANDSLFDGSRGYILMFDLSPRTNEFLTMNNLLNFSDAIALLVEKGYVRG